MNRGPGSRFHAVALRIGKAMKARAWKLDEKFCPCCGTRMWFPQYERKRKGEARVAQRQSLVSLDHITRVADGGTNQDTNLRLICQGCNSGRHD